MSTSTSSDIPSPRTSCDATSIPPLVPRHKLRAGVWCEEGPARCQGELVPTALALMASNSCWVIVPLSRSCLAFSISLAGAAGAGGMANVLIETGLCRLGFLGPALSHPGVVGDQVDQHANPRENDDKDHPRSLHPARNVVTPEEVDKNGDRDPNEETHAQMMRMSQRTFRKGYDEAAMSI